MEKFYADVGQDNFKHSVLTVIRSSLDSERLILKLQDGISMNKSEIDKLILKTNEMNESIQNLSVKEFHDVKEIKSKIEDLNEDLIDKTRLIEFKIKQFEGSDTEEEVDNEEQEMGNFKRGKVEDTIFGSGRKFTNKSNVTQTKVKSSTDDLPTAAPKNIKDVIKNVNANSKKINDQMDKLQFKVDSQYVEMFNRLKKDVNSKIIINLIQFSYTNSITFSAFSNSSFKTAS